MAMNPIALRATLINIAGNSFLFAIKLIAGLLSGSIALISDAFNSLTDIGSSIAVFICVRISDREADEGHPFGHSRAEPIAGIIIAILAGIVGFEVMRAAVKRLLFGGEVMVGALTVAVPLITMALKSFMSWYFRKTARAVNSPAIMASSVDSLCDVFVSLAALIGIVGARSGYGFLDPMAALVISLWIIYTGYRIGMENIDYLMGSAPSPELVERIRGMAMGVTGVRALNTIRAHYVGNFIHVEIHIEVDRDLKTADSYVIGKDVEMMVESIRSIEKAFVHIEPF
ncbi:MAG: cation transporter [Deltaproteobacteria bacterium]|nr:cation transporter [Deltaproteobacteria bacterium]